MVNNGYDDGFHDGFNNNLVGGIPTPLYPSEKWWSENQLGLRTSQYMEK